MEYIGLLIAIISCVAVAGGMLAISVFVGPKRPNPTKNEPFECGAEKVKPMPESFPAKFYLVAILFVLFDIELAFFYPWAMALTETGLYGLAIIGLYMAILIFGFSYFWMKGGFDWK
jgi:NADH-quinone oxidoreductase subunit A